MKRNLLSRINLESDDEGVMGGIDGSLENTQEAVIEAIVVAQDGDEIVRDQAQLESAFISLNNIIGSAQNLEDAGVDQEVINETLVPDAIDAVASVDEGLAEETETEAVVAMEADDKKGVWATIKEKLIAMWEALKKNLSRFWSWLKSLFGKSKQTAAEVQKAAGSLIKSLSEVKEDKAVEVPAKAAWCVNDKPVVPSEFVSAVAKMKPLVTQARKNLMSELTQVLENIKSNEAIKEISTGMDDAEFKRFVTKGMSQFDAQKKLLLESASRANQISLVKTNGLEAAFIGFTFTENEMKPAEFKGDGSIKFSGKADIQKYLEGVKTRSFMDSNSESVITRVERLQTDVLALLDKQLKANNVEGERITLFRPIMQAVVKMEGEVMKATRDSFAAERPAILSNALSLGQAAVTALKKAA